MKLIKYRDWGMPSHTYFWVNDDDQILSPYFDNQEEAEQWMLTQQQKLDITKGENNENTTRKRLC